MLIFVSITIGQALRLRSNLIEVAISGMLVLGVGSLAAQPAAGQRIAETLVGAAVGMAVNLLFPPKVASADAGRAIDGLADSISELLTRAADELAEIVAEGRDVAPAARAWLDDAAPHHPRHPAGRRRAAAGGGGAAAQRPRRRHAERGAGAASGPGVARAHRRHDPRDAPGGGGRHLRPRLGRRGEPRGRVARARPDLPRDGRRHRCVRAAGARRGRSSEAHELCDVEALDVARDGLHEARARLDDLLTAGVAPGTVELHAAVLSSVKRLLRELDLDERMRRQVRLMPPPRPRLPHARGSVSSDPPTSQEPSPDAETQRCRPAGAAGRSHLSRGDRSARPAATPRLLSRHHGGEQGTARRRRPA